MYRSNTTDFILSPLANILSEATNALVVVNDGMYGYQLADWVMPTVFLRMTGAQEQKLKCICWDLRSVDLEERNQRYEKRINEMSCYDDKNHLCQELLLFLSRNKRGFDPVTDINRNKLRQEALDEVKAICNNTLLKDWFSVSYKEFEEVIHSFKIEHFMVCDTRKGKYKELFENELREAYESLYYHRIRCAHNSTSFQYNLPKFEVLSGKKAVYENYFVQFFLLILLDKLFVQLYRWTIDLIEF